MLDNREADWTTIRGINLLAQYQPARNHRYSVFQAFSLEEMGDLVS